jgi:hypothetical protein
MGVAAETVAVFHAPTTRPARGAPGSGGLGVVERSKCTDLPACPDVAGDDAMAAAAAASVLVVALLIFFLAGDDNAPPTRELLLLLLLLLLLWLRVAAGPGDTSGGRLRAELARRAVNELASGDGDAATINAGAGVVCCCCGCCCGCCTRSSTCSMGVASRTGTSSFTAGRVWRCGSGGLAVCADASPSSSSLAASGSR